MKEIREFWRTLSPDEKAMIIIWSFGGAALLFITVGLLIIVGGCP